MTMVPAASFEDRLAARRDQLIKKTSFELPVPVYDGLWARYKILGYEDIRDIGTRNEEQATTAAESERNTAADVLSDACVELLELKGYDEEQKPVFRSLGYRWTDAAARDLFKVDVPVGVTGRGALQEIFPYPHDTPMITHFNAYMIEADIGLGVIDEAMQGESRASSAAT